MQTKGLLPVLFFFWGGSIFSQPFGTDNLTTSINTGLNATVVGLSAAMNQAVDRLGLILEKQSRLTVTSIDLNGKIDNLDTRIQEDLLSLQNDFSNLSNQLLIVSNSIPFSKKLPQLSSITPYNKSNDVISLNIKGNFVFLRKARFNAYLTQGIKNMGYAKQKLNNLLVFDINKKDLVYKATEITDNYFNVIIPYKGFLKAKYASYIIDVKTYPLILGKLDIYQNNTTITKEIVHFTSPEIIQASDHDDKKDILHCATADDGYTVDKTTVDKTITWSQGREGNDKDFWFGDNSNSTPGNACFTLTTIHHRIGTSGKVHFKIKFDEYKNVETTTESIFWTSEIQDGFVSSVKLPQTISRIVFTQFDGKVYEFDSNFETDFLRFMRSGSYLFIKKK